MASFCRYDSVFKSNQFFGFFVCENMKPFLNLFIKKLNRAQIVFPVHYLSLSLLNVVYSTARHKNS